MTEEPLPALPKLALEPEIAVLVATMFAAPMEDDGTVFRQLEARLDTIRAAAHRDDYLDIGLVERIGQALERLLRAVATRDAADRRLVQTAVRYFIDEQDAIADLSSPTGFDDDAIVVGVVARHLGLTELLPRGL